MRWHPKAEDHLWTPRDAGDQALGRRHVEPALQGGLEAALARSLPGDAGRAPALLRRALRLLSGSAAPASFQSPRAAPPGCLGNGGASLPKPVPPGTVPALGCGNGLRERGRAEQATEGLPCGPTTSQPARRPAARARPSRRGARRRLRPSPQGKARPIKAAAIYTVPIEQQWVSRIHKALNAAKDRGDVDLQMVGERRQQRLRAHHAPVRGGGERPRPRRDLRGRARRPPRRRELPEGRLPHGLVLRAVEAEPVGLRQLHPRTLAISPAWLRERRRSPARSAWSAATPSRRSTGSCRPSWTARGR